MCTSEPVSLESSAAACAAWRASSEPSVASRIFVGNMLISSLLLEGFPYLVFSINRHKYQSARGTPISRRATRAGRLVWSARRRSQARRGCAARTPLAFRLRPFLKRKQSPQLDSHSRWPLGHQQVDNVQRWEDVEQGDEDHDRRSPALEPGPLRQVPSVGEVEQRRVGGHHEKASRCGQYQEYDRLDARPYEYRATDGHEPHDRSVDLALAPELAVSKDGHLE